MASAAFKRMTYTVRVLATRLHTDAKDERGRGGEAMEKEAAEEAREK